MTLFFTSDLHLGHRLVAEVRKFDSVDQHDKAVLDRWVDVVHPKDQVWILGDIAASTPRHALELLAKLPGEKHLVAGNHDRCHPMHRDAHRRQREFLNVFTSVQSAARRRIGGREVLLSHFPYERDRGEQRHPQWRLRDEGLPLLHGHTHGAERLTVTPQLRWDHTGQLSRIEVHVGVDAWGLRPVSLDQVDDLLAEAEYRPDA